ncbi:glycine-rich cell wall structural protein 2-like [Pararge aegeria]|uniref:glycine-rich cell wall structural protein 2-like n=1 Tax=Pararge aegeria TaxID=116150 RepID=UPI0019D1DC87|nr:glycine-rich cell wall structural protein 2-like [Pararge aegeria]
MGSEYSIIQKRSPVPSGWQGSGGYGSSSVGLARSGGGWGNGGSTFGRSSGWGGSAGSGGNTRSYSGYNSNGCANSNGWDDASIGLRSNPGSTVW